MDEKTHQEGQIALAMQAIQKNQISSIRKAAKFYNVPLSTLSTRLRGTQSKRGSKAINRLLLPAEEESLIKWILLMEKRGFPPFLINVKRMAQTLLERRDNTKKSRSIGKLWVYHFHQQNPSIKAYLTRQ